MGNGVLLTVCTIQVQSGSWVVGRGSSSGLRRSPPKQVCSVQAHDRYTPRRAEEAQMGGENLSCLNFFHS